MADKISSMGNPSMGMESIEAEIGLMGVKQVFPAMTEENEINGSGRNDARY